MAGSERLYILKTVDGEEFGPVDQECLVRWAENGRITPYCQIRSTLIARWENASEIPFLRDILIKQLEEKETRDESIFAKIKQRATMRAVEAVEFSGIHEVRPDDFESASPVIRFLAGLVDIVVVVIMGVILFLGGALAYSTQILGANEVFYIGFFLYTVLVVMYFVYSMGGLGQTIGQKFWGIILIRKTGEQYYLGRAFAYTLGLLCFGLLTPLFVFVSPSRRSMQEIMTSTRMVRTKLIGKRR